MGIIGRIEKFIDKINFHAFKIARWLVLILTLTLFYEVFMRYVFNRPTIWSYDVSYMLGGTFFTLGMGYTLQKNIHVRVDIFYNLFKKRIQALIDVLFTIFMFFPSFTMLIYKLIPYVRTSWLRQERAVGSFWMPPIYPFKTVLLFSVLLLFVQMISMLIKNFRILFAKESEDERGAVEDV
ncbi:MAG TPA: TRAP transporter small permease subunit [Clostridia bacterium]|nr:TRAP transporter small permease subunit [Clostridia bacterium]